MDFLSGLFLFCSFFSFSTRINSVCVQGEDKKWEDVFTALFEDYLPGIPPTSLSYTT